MDTQTNLFEMMYEPYKITKPIRLIELFGGIGSQAKALENLNANFEHYRLIEFDKYPVASYNAIHGTNFEPKDITKIKAEDLGIVETDKYEYIMTYSFPCQDLSLAGKQRGMAKGSGTRSGLLWEVERLLSESKELPQILLMENVPDVIGKKNISDFQQWQLFLEKLGYKNYVEILNAKDYGIPQNRRRCFMISLLGDYSYTFPDKQALHLRLKDMLEPQVDEKYFLSDKMISYISAINQKWAGSNNGAFINKDIASTLTTGEGSRRCDASNYVSDDLPDNYNLQNTERIIISGKTKSGGGKSLILDERGISNCLLATDYKQPKQILIREATKKGYTEAQDGDGVYINRPHQKRGVVQKGMIQTINTSLDIGVVVEEVTLKKQLCNELVKSGLLKEYDVVNHSYTNGLTGKNPNSRQKLEDYIETTDNSSPCLTTRPDTIGVVVNAEIKPKLVGGIGDKKSNGGSQYYQQDRIYDSESIAMAHPANLPGGSYKYLVKDKLGNEILLHKDTKQLRETIQNCELEQGKALNLDLYNRASYEESQTITEPHHNSQRLFDGLRIRKLTPKECYRLMGFSDEDFEKSESVPTSNTQLYKQAGNSIVVNVLEAIFKQLL